MVQFGTPKRLLLIFLMVAMEWTRAWSNVFDLHSLIFLSWSYKRFLQTGNIPMSNDVEVSYYRARCHFQFRSMRGYFSHTIQLELRWSIRIQTLRQLKMRSKRYSPIISFPKNRPCIVLLRSNSLTQNSSDRNTFQCRKSFHCLKRWNDTLFEDVLAQAKWLDRLQRKVLENHVSTTFVCCSLPSTFHHSSCARFQNVYLRFCVFIRYTNDTQHGKTV